MQEERKVGEDLLFRAEALLYLLVFQVFAHLADRWCGFGRRLVEDLHRLLDGRRGLLCNATEALVR